jgi:LAO/AO transport system kinase
LSASGELQEKRQGQRWKAVWSALQDRLMTDLKNHPAVFAALPAVHKELHDGNLTVTLATERILDLFQKPTADLG